MDHLPLNALPEALATAVNSYWQRWLEAAANAGVEVPEDERLLNDLVSVWAGSEFVANAMIQQPALLTELHDSGDLYRRYPPDSYAKRLAGLLEDVADEATLAQRLRRFRGREMVRIAWRDLAGRADLDETLAETSALADACIQGALQVLYPWQCEEWGTPLGSSGEPQSLVVLGMGKLGACELNFSSDIDLIFAYPEAGQTDGDRPRTNEQFFLRLGQRLVGALDTRTADGYVFRVDLRLRPYGESGPLAMSFAAMEQYYQAQGREWERYAMIKARVVAGDEARGAELLDLLRPFVYRRYLDYSAFESLRDMKAMIMREVLSKGMDANVKLGAGGIREVEFIGQAFQLVRGGRVPALQVRPIQEVLALLAEQQLLPEYVARELRDAYRFLRRVENRLQEYADQQVHSLPSDEVGRLRLAYTMGFDDWSSFEKALNHHRERVEGHFEQVFAAPQGDEGAGGEERMAALWQGALSDEEALDLLEQQGYRDPAEALRRITALRGSAAARSLSERGRSRLDRLMPLILGAVAGLPRPYDCLSRLVALIEAIARRTAYLSLLIEHPMALSQLVKLVAASPWIARFITHHPLLMDELLDPRTLYHPATREQLEAELAYRLGAIPADDLEQQMETLRHFKQVNVLRVAAVDVAGAMPLMVVSDHLTAIAEVVLEQVLNLAWAQIAARHGEPCCGIGGERRRAGFIIVAYGKLGGIELGYGSDLDIVFLHDSAGEKQFTDGEKSVDNSVFFARLGQRIIHLLSTATPSGVLYEVDTRLRPSGASGLLVSSIEAFAEYQKNEAWTWEHQALVRARPVAGDSSLAGRFEAIRAEILGRERAEATLRSEVREMREKMREQLGARQGGWFDLKQDAGGIADIEFLVQYLVLRWAASYPEVYRYTDNIRQLEALAKSGVLSEEEAGTLTDAYRTFRARVHRLKLQEEPARVPDTEYAKEREAVQAIWRRVMES
ncbi:MAG: bifunctional [glutamate--ammonia ligase]-adenylyl-L-tyrosine phosphorylase/[glutamate--ammonia-ligase] adenylyltransferase [Gammaproteobacteria bacterium]